MNNNEMMLNSELDRLIPPEVKDDDFYEAIQNLAKEASIKTVLEIGSSSGGGSTEAFVKGLRHNPSHPILFCIEISKPRFLELQSAYSSEGFVKCYNASSVPAESFPSASEVVDFYTTIKTNLNLYPNVIDQVLLWLNQDLEYVKKFGIEQRGIKKIKKENNIDFFDLVLIDGSDFTGEAELQEVYGAKFILLDDVKAFKNFNNYKKLILDEKYTLISQNLKLRNGYAIFKRISDVDQTGLKEEQAEQYLAKRLVNLGMTVFDIGANVGDYSLLLSELVGHSGKVYAFEPTSNTFQKLQQRVSQHSLENITILKTAVFCRNTSIELNEFPEEYSAWNSIGKPSMLNPKNGIDYVPIVATEMVEAITLDSFCQKQSIEKIDYLKVDVEGAESNVFQGAQDLLRKQAIHFIQFEISQKMLEGLNRTAEGTFQILIQNGYECHRITPLGEIGEQVNNSTSFYENYLAFPSLPIHFFTIVLNGDPFIKYHIDIFNQLPFEWHWHIVEGVADLKNDTAWSVRLGGHITEEIHQNGLSKDGTTKYLDELAELYPDRVTIYRKPERTFWDGKLEMVNAPLANIDEECLLWQIDVDELWTVEQIHAARRLFIQTPNKTAAFYWCYYFVGEQLLISSRYCYAQNPQQEWLRTWRYQPGCYWAAHEPPILVQPNGDGWKDVASINPFLHQETEAKGLVFQHFAYVTLEQLEFKEKYYGYVDACTQWQSLQAETRFPLLLRDYFAWVHDETVITTAESLGIVPIAQKEKTTNAWKFLSLEDLQQQVASLSRPQPTIVIDGVFFQLYKTGIARVWRSLLEEWVNTGFAKHLLVLDRARTAPDIPGVRYRLIPPYDYNHTENDRQLLQQICDEEGADLLISTYYTTPVSTPSVLMVYDMIPEVVGADLTQPMWREKHNSINYASAYIAISQNTAHDLVKFFPKVNSAAITVAHSGVAPSFAPANSEAINAFKYRYGIFKPYFLLSGARGSYKNAAVFFQAFSQLVSKLGFDIVCTGVATSLEAEFRLYAAGSTVHMLHLEDDELSLAYAGAIALVYPSIYEGFGLPIVEAMACGCPVIACPNASIPEVAGPAAVYVQPGDVSGLTSALCEIQKPEVRQSLIQAGLEQAKQFSWQKMAQQVSEALINATLASLNLSIINLIVFPDWNQSEEVFCTELADLIRAIATHPDRNRMTLLIYSNNISTEDANLALSSITMNLLLEEELEVDDGPEISLISDLSSSQWQVLLSRTQSRVTLPHEDHESIDTVSARQLPILEVQQLLTLSTS
ncbi:FkbM family methyltransferase [Trichocoleus sp. FACHB-591]|nr:FkbM family methyltransferase [Trichocoleus sp. FACHB-591]